MNTVMNTVQLEAGKLYLMSGAPGAGKSTWLASGDIPESMVVSADALRLRLLGAHCTPTETLIHQKNNAAVFQIIAITVEARLAERLTTFVDATLLTEADRNDLAKIAHKYGVPVEVLIFDRPLEVLQARNQSRKAIVPADSVEAAHAALVRTSALPHQFVMDGSKPALTPRMLPSNDIDVIGDVHGLLDLLLEMLEKLGYDMSSGVPVHPAGRKLLFLGDIVDRGPQSIQVLKLAKMAVEKGGHFMVAGNHERKLLQFWDSLQKGLPETRSRSSAQTAMALMRLPLEERQPLVDFVRKLPSYYVREGFVFAHANLTYFDPYSTLHTECLYGCEFAPFNNNDTDALYAAGFPAQNQYRLIRGHIRQTSEQDVVYSLEGGQAYEGDLMALRFDQFYQNPTRTSFEAAVVRVRSTFNYDDHAHVFALHTSLGKLAQNKLVSKTVDPTSGLAVHKYSKRCFFDRAWGTNPALLKARGIVMDMAGTIVSHPFDKVFNYGEDSGLPEDKGVGAGMALDDNLPLIAIEKLNGFLGICSAHPFDKEQLLVHTQGRFEGEHVGYIQEYMTPRQAGLVKRFFANNDVTLMFEVLHPSDPHIVHYDDSEHGLWLIGVRGKNITDQAWPEEAVDAAALEMGFRRPKWFRTTKRELLAMCKNDSLELKVEGWMARADTPEQQLLFKLKTPYYLVTKFLGRLSAGRVGHMFGNPSNFKQSIDEEFFVLVDELTSRFTKEEFLAMDDLTRVPFVRGLVHELLA